MSDRQFQLISALQRRSPWPGVRLKESDSLQSRRLGMSRDPEDHRDIVEKNDIEAIAWNRGWLGGVEFPPVK